MADLSVVVINDKHTNIACLIQDDCQVCDNLENPGTAVNINDATEPKSAFLWMKCNNPAMDEEH